MSKKSKILKEYDKEIREAAERYLKGRKETAARTRTTTDRMLEKMKHLKVLTPDELEKRNNIERNIEKC